MIFTPRFKIPKVRNNTDKNSDEHFIIMQATIKYNKKEMKSNKQDSDDKMTQFTEELKRMLA